MKIGFAGTPAFAAVILQHLINTKNYDITFVLTQPDRPSGRGMNVMASAVKNIAIQYDLTIHQPTSLKLNGPDEILAQHIHNLMQQIDILVVAAYGLMLPTSLVDNHVCLNVHASLLPRWRGAAPIHRAIQAQDTHTGISIMHMNKGLDTGDILSMHSIPIEKNNNTEEMHNKLAQLGAESIHHSLQNFEHLFLHKITQSTFNEKDISYAHKISKQDVLLDLAAEPALIQAHLHAFSAAPMAKIGQCKIHKAQADFLPSTIKQKHNINGEIIKLGDSIDVICYNGAGVLKIYRLQMPNKRSMTAAEFLLGHTLKIGDNIINYTQ